MYTEAQEKYKNFCESLPYVPIYQKSWWLDATAEPQHWSAVFAEKNGVVQAALPFMVKKKYGMTVLTQPPFTQFLGPLFNQQAQKEDTRLANEKKWTNALIDALPRHHIFMQSFAHSVTNWLPWYWRGFGQTTRYSYVIPDISDIESVLMTFEKKKRWEATRLQGELCFSETSDYNLFYSFHKKVLDNRKRSISYSIFDFKKLYKTCIKYNSCFIFIVEDVENNIIAANFCVKDERNSYSILLPIDFLSKYTDVSSFLFFNMIKFLSGKVRNFDFEGSMIESIEKSYRKFGTHQTPYFSISRGSNIVISSLLHARDYWIRNK